VQALEQALAQNAAKSPAGEQGRAITFMADETVPYEIIEKLIDLCQTQDYRQIAFAANLKAAPKGSP
jgi:biopolymer transport protein ExbD